MKVSIILFKALIPLITIPLSNPDFRFNNFNQTETILKRPAIRATDYLHRISQIIKIHRFTGEKSGYLFKNHKLLFPGSLTIPTPPEIIPPITGNGSNCRVHAPPSD
jgi:hypothetical protein